MQLTIQQLRAAVLEHVSADWVRENFGKLTLKQTWVDAYDRTREFAAAKLEQAQEAIQSERGQQIIATTKATAAKAFWLGVDAVIFVAKWAIIAVLVILELCQEGAIEQITAKSTGITAKIDSASNLAYWELSPAELLQRDPAVAYRSPALAQSWPIAA